MQISSRFTIAVHMLLCMETFKESTKITSDFLASSVQVNPVVIRRILSQLKNANIIDVVKGTGGATIKQPLNQITLLDVFKSVQSLNNENIFNFHEKPNPDCPVGKNIHTLLDEHLNAAYQALENELSKVTIEDLLKKEMI